MCVDPYMFGPKRALSILLLLLLDNGILSQLSTLGMPQYNGVAERRNQTLLDMVRSMMSYSDLPKFLWGFALGTTAYILNSIPTKYAHNTPTEL